MSTISIEGLSKRYPPRVNALNQLSVEMPDGVCGLVGANGAGKSTLIKILLGLLQPTAGGARVLGLDVGSQAREIRRRVGYMPEHDCLPPDVSAAEFVSHMARVSGLPADAARERTSDTLRHVGLDEARYRPIGGYSTGMKQRVKLAQALVHDPELVFLDEPTNGLDPAGRDEMLDLVRRLHVSFGISVMVTSHLLGELERISDHVVVIDGGTLLKSEDTSTLTAETFTAVVEVLDTTGEGEGAAIAEQALRDRGASPRRFGEQIYLEVDSEDDYDQIRDAVVDAGLGLSRLQRQRRQLSEIFASTAAPAAPATQEGAPDGN